MTAQVFDISTGRPLVPSEPDWTEPAEDFTPRTAREQRIYWLAFADGWREGSDADPDNLRAGNELADIQREIARHYGEQFLSPVS